MASAKRDRAPFKERTELLDFLLEVAAVTAETLDSIGCCPPSPTSCSV